MFDRRRALLRSGSDRDDRAEIDWFEAESALHLGQLLFGAGQAGPEAFDLAEDDALLGFVNAVVEVGDDVFHPCVGGEDRRKSWDVRWADLGSGAQPAGGTQSCGGRASPGGGLKCRTTSEAPPLTAQAGAGRSARVRFMVGYGYVDGERSA